MLGPCRTGRHRSSLRSGCATSARRGIAVPTTGLASASTAARSSTSTAAWQTRCRIFDHAGSARGATVAGAPRLFAWRRGRGLVAALRRRSWFSVVRSDDGEVRAAIQPRVPRRVRAARGPVHCRSAHRADQQRLDLGIDDDHRPVLLVADARRHHTRSYRLPRNKASCLELAESPPLGISGGWLKAWPTLPRWGTDELGLERDVFARTSSVT